MLEHIRQSNLIEDIDSEKEDQQSLKAWNFLNGQTCISHSNIRKTHLLIVLNQNNLSNLEKGTYRGETNQHNVMVGVRVCPKWQEVGTLMEKWVKEMASSGGTSFTPINMHVRFEKIHPFCDGNGRVGRMLLWWHQIRAGQAPTLFIAAERHEYYALFFEEPKISVLNWGKHNESF